METLVVVDQHRSRYHGKNKSHGSPSRVFREINCRAFQSGAGILPTPAKAWAHVAKSGLGFSPASSFPKTPSPVSLFPKTPSPVSLFPKTPSPASVKLVSEEKTNTRKSKRSTLRKSSSVPIPFNLKVNYHKEKSLYCKELSYSELWAGPAYSNSPPPSSLPIPKFSVPPKRSGSPDLPSSESHIDLHPVSRSAPPSPKRDHASSARKVFHSADYASATKDLRRILNLDLTDE